MSELLIEKKQKWNVFPLSELVECLDGQRRPVKKEDRENIVGKYPYYGASGIIDYVNDFIFDDDLILLGEDGENIISRNLPLAFKIQGKNWVNNHAHVLKTKQGYDIDFLVYILENRDYKDIVSGSAQPKINQKNLMKLEFLVPEKNQQQKIAHILTTCDTVIEQTQSAIAKYKAINQGLLHDLFTCGLDANGRLRPSYQQAPELYKESELGMISKEWEVKRISELIKQGILDDIQDGNHGEIHPKSDDFVSVGIPFVMASDISNDILNLEDCHKISKEQYQSLRIGFSKSGDILLSHKASIGFVARVPNVIKEIMLTPQVTYYRVLKDNVLSTNYLEYFMRSDPFQNNLQLMAKQSTRDYIGITMQKTLYIAFPEDLNEQLQIANTCHSIRNKIKIEETLLQKYQLIKRGLMGDLLGGRKEVY